MIHNLLLHVCETCNARTHEVKWTQHITKESATSNGSTFATCQASGIWVAHAVGLTSKRLHLNLFSPLHPSNDHLLDNTMAETQILRRSGRERNAVKSYTDEQADEERVAQAAPPKRKSVSPKAEINKAVAKKPTQTSVKNEQLSDFEDAELRKKRSKAAIKREQAAGKVDAAGIRRLVTTERRPPGERQMPQIWDIPAQPKGPKKAKGLNLAALMAETFEDRRQRQVSRIPRLRDGEEETRLKRSVICVQSFQHC